MQPRGAHLYKAGAVEKRHWSSGFAGFAQMVRVKDLLRCFITAIKHGLCSSKIHTHRISLKTPSCPDNDLNVSLHSLLL